nr:MAG TPA: hypothetical protein [Caudoviricetes sp.]
MNDDKKIEEAARLDDKEYYDRLSDNDRCFFEYGFRRGYNRALKDLWHPASEKPNIKQGECCVTCLVKFKNGSTELCVYFRNPEGWVCDDMSPKDFKRIRSMTKFKVVRYWDTYPDGVIATCDTEEEAEKIRKKYLSNCKPMYDYLVRKENE